MRRALAVLVVLAACDREARPFEEEPPHLTLVDRPPIPTLHAGLRPTAPPTPSAYDESAWAIAEGKRLYVAFNCVGCHGNGGGGMGPPLLDATWIYGSTPANIYDTIVEGRPNGMPAWRGKLNEQELWKLVAYVRSISGLVRDDAVSARSDHMMSIPPPTTSDDPTPIRERAVVP